MLRGKRKADVGFASIAANLRNEEVDTEGGIFVFQVRFDLINRSLKELGALAKTTNDANTACYVISATYISCFG